MEQTEFTKIENWDDAYKRLIEGVGQRDASFIMGFYRDEWKDHLPHIEVSGYEKGQPTGYKSTLESFPRIGFATELEANLANAIWLIAQTSETPLERRRFEMVFSLVLELLNVKSDWRQF